MSTKLASYQQPLPKEKYSAFQMRCLTPCLRVRNCCGAIQAVISQVSRSLRWISWQQQLVSSRLDRRHLLDRHNITPTLLMNTRIYLRVSDGARVTWNGNVTVVNLVASSRVHRDCAAPSDRGEESMADFHMAVWVWAGRACSNAPVVDGRVFCSGALVTVVSPYFGARPREAPTCFRSSCQHDMQQWTQ